MSPNSDPVLVYVTCPSTEVAEAVGTPLVTSGLAACLNILPRMTSIYRWQGQLHKDSECVLLVKTRAALADRITAHVRSHHPYDEPAVLVLAVAGGSASYIDWIRDATAAPRDPNAASEE